MDNELMKSLANKYNRTVAQIAIRWSIQNGFVSIPKSKTKKFIQDNFNVTDFVLTQEEMEKIKALNKDFHTCWNPHSVIY
jgi:diketogulonate reductase-like aldo/keto reductase